MCGVVALVSVFQVVDEPAYEQIGKTSAGGQNGDIKELTARFVLARQKQKKLR